MPTFYARHSGTTLRVLPPSAAGITVPFRIRFSGLALGSEVEASAIITQSNIEMAELYHITHAVGGDSYIYALGDKHDTLQVAGSAFSLTCGASSTDGLDHILRLYRNNRLSRRAAPVLVGFGRSIWRCYLVGGRLGMTDAERQIGAWQMMLQGVQRA